MSEEQDKPGATTISGKDMKVTITTADGEVREIDAEEVSYAPLGEKPKKISARKLSRMEREARFVVHPPRSSWKRADGTTAVAGPRVDRR